MPGVLEGVLNNHSLLDDCARLGNVAQLIVHAVCFVTVLTNTANLHTGVYNDHAYIAENLDRPGRAVGPPRGVSGPFTVM